MSDHEQATPTSAAADAAPTADDVVTNGDKTEPLTPSATEGDEAEGPSLDERIAALEKERDEYLDQWRRSAAEFQNFRKREDRLRQERERRASERLLARLLPVLDDLQRAAQHVPEQLDGNDWVEGMLAIERKLWNVLAQEGVSVIDAEAGTPFDPKVHEALVSVEHEEIEPEHIVDEYERGYRHHDAVLRPARVSVAR